MNPFQAGSYDGQPVYHLTADDRIRAVARFDMAQCKAALALPNLQKTVTAAVQRRLRDLERIEGGRP